MYIEELLNFYCQDTLGLSENPAALAQEEKPPIIDEVDEEVLSLARYLGGIQNGQRIQMTLQELLTVVPHQRRRSDSYTRLIKRLREDYAVSLEIVAAKTKNHERKNK